MYIHMYVFVYVHVHIYICICIFNSQSLVRLAIGNIYMIYIHLYYMHTRLYSTGTSI